MKKNLAVFLAGLVVGAGAVGLVAGRYEVTDTSLQGRGVTLPRQMMRDRWTGETWHREMSGDWRRIKRE